MLAAYLFALVVGGALLVASLVGGHHDAGHDGGAGHDAGHDTDTHDTHHGAKDLAWSVLSVRFWTYALAFGGATGVLLHLLAHAPEPLTGLLSAGVGASAGLFVQALIARAARGGSGMTSHQDLVGKPAQVIVPFTRSQTGKIRLQTGDGVVDVLATTEEDGELGQKQEVVILEFREGRALVARAALALKE
ncbi:MAG TPA: hypothetical protein VFA20_30470 [Myxococcaceae bacterium]|nr:hypothetical protein [Myxococcaceae bacterium]